MRQEGEPSVEEILESIKNVMERDKRQSALALQQRREAEGIIRTIPIEPADEEEAEEILDLSEAGSPLEEVDGAEEGEADARSHDDEDDRDGLAEAEAEEDAELDHLTNENAAAAMRQSLAALAMLSDPPARPQIVREGETSLEGLVREMLRPMLAQWLDAHLPDIVDRHVKAEIARIAGKRG